MICINNYSHHQKLPKAFKSKEGTIAKIKQLYFIVIVVYYANKIFCKSTDKGLILCKYIFF